MARALGGAVTYAALAAQRLGWEAAVLTTAGPDFDPAAELPAVTAFVGASAATTRFQNLYEEDGSRVQVASPRAGPIDVSALADVWRDPDVLLLAPVVGEVPAGTALAFEAGVVGAIAQGWLRGFEPDGAVFPQAWADPGRDLPGVHVLFLSEHDEPGVDPHTHLAHAPLVLVTRGWRGVTLISRGGDLEVPALPCPEVDPTGAGDVFAAAFLVRYRETDDPHEAAVFAACAASCAVEGIGTSTLGDRAEVERRLARRERMLEEGEWEE